MRLEGVRKWLKEADEYCFGFGSPVSLGLFRLGFASLLFVNFSMIALDWDSWFSERGFMPRWLASIWFGNRTPLGFYTDIWIPRMNLLAGLQDPRLTIAFYAITVLAALLTAIGLFTRASSFILMLGVVTLHDRNGAILHGGDTLVRVMTVYIAVSPCGRACSLDRLIKLWRSKTILPAEKISVWSQRLISYNVALLYFTTLWLKWDGDKWRHLTATYYPQRLAEFYRFPVPDFLKSGFMSHITTLGTISTEFLMGTLVFYRPARSWVIIAAILMHSYIEYSMNIPLFSFLMMATYVSFYDGEEVSAFCEKIGLRLKRFHAVVRLPHGMRLAPSAIGFAAAIDPFRMVTFLPGAGPEWHAETIEGKPIDVKRAILARCPGAWPFATFPGLLLKRIQSDLLPVEIEAPVDAAQAEDVKPRAKAGKVRR